MAASWLVGTANQGTFQHCAERWDNAATANAQIKENSIRTYTRAGSSTLSGWVERSGVPVRAVPQAALLPAARSRRTLPRATAAVPAARPAPPWTHAQAQFYRRSQKSCRCSPSLCTLCILCILFVTR